MEAAPRDAARRGGGLEGGKRDGREGGETERIKGKTVTQSGMSEKDGCGISS